jgi:hypothetical protein
MTRMFMRFPWPKGLSSFEPYFTAYEFVGWCASYQGVTRKGLFALRAVTRRGGGILNNPFFKALHQSAFTTFSVFEQLRVTAFTENIDGFGGAFFIRFCHLDCSSVTTCRKLDSDESDVGCQSAMV